MCIRDRLKPLGIAPEQIRLFMNDTARCPNSGAAAASRSQTMTGNAIVDSCKKLLDAMRKPDGTYRTYDEMVAENIPTFYEGKSQAQVLHKDGSVESCGGNDKDTGIGKPFALSLIHIYPRSSADFFCIDNSSSLIFLQDDLFRPEYYLY